MALPQLLQSLPQELYDEIYEHTFGIPNPKRKSTSTSTLPSTSKPEPSNSALPPTSTPKPSTTSYIIIDEDYTPPMQLRIDRQMRQEFRATYYNTTFIGYAPDMVSWFRSLSDQDRALVKSIQCWLIKEGGRARISPTRTGGFKTYDCELKDLGAKEVDYCLYKDCAEKKLRDPEGKLRICHI